MSDPVPSIPLPQQAQENCDYHRNFARHVMSDVFALLDFLSGRALPSQSNGHRRLDVTNGQIDQSKPMSIHQIERILDDPRLIRCHAMRIAARLDATDLVLDSVDTALLTIARDQLNAQAAPATGSSISFTIQVIERLRGDKAKLTNTRPHASFIISDESLEAFAVKFAKFVKCGICYMKFLLVLVFIVSTYVASGKLLLDTRDAANKDFGANMSTLAAEVDHYHQVAQALGNQRAQDAHGPRPDNRYEDEFGFIDDFCEQHAAADILVHDSCYQRADLVKRKNSNQDLLAKWTYPIRFNVDVSSPSKAEQYAATTVGIAGNYVLPVLYGALGSFGFVLRRLNRQLANYLLMPRDLRASQIRVVLGIATGACIGLFVNAPASAATLTGFGGAVVTLSASGIAFLAGYGVEGVFKMLDALISHLFRIDEERKEATYR